MKGKAKHWGIVGLVSGVLLIGLLALISGESRPNYRYDDKNPLHAHFSGQRAFEHVRAMVEIGPRPSGSKAIERNRVYLEKELAKLGWLTERQNFTDDTPLGKIDFVNLRARFGSGDESAKVWKRRAFVLVGSHYDTKRFREIRFVGANDAGSSTGALLELARIAAKEPAFAQHLELVFFDGEEAIEKFSDIDGLYGSRFYARTIIRPQKQSERPQAVVILDMVGEKDLTIRVPVDTPEHLGDALNKSAAELGFSKHFGVWRTKITDDHVPFMNEGVDAIDLIDFDYQAWHTSRDTLDKLDPRSLEITGQTTILLIGKHLLATQ